MQNAGQKRGKRKRRWETDAAKTAINPFMAEQTRFFVHNAVVTITVTTRTSKKLAPETVRLPEREHEIEHKKKRKREAFISINTMSSTERRKKPILLDITANTVTKNYPMLADTATSIQKYPARPIIGEERNARKDLIIPDTMN